MNDSPDRPAPPPNPAYDPIAAEHQSGLKRAMGYYVTAWREDFAEVRLDVKEPHLNRSGMVHGGVLMTLIDTAAGLAGVYCPYPGRVRRAMTLNVSTNFIGQTKGDSLIATAHKIGGGRSVFFTECDIHDELGTLIARGSGTFRYRTGSGDPMGVPLEPEST